MIRFVLLGKNDISEQIAWCKRSATAKEESERLQNAKLEIQGNLDVVMNLSEPALDSVKIGPKLKPFNLRPAPSADLEVFTGRIIKQISIFARFEGSEKVPGRIDYEYGLGFFVETFNIFLEDSVYKTVEVTQERKKMGIFKETFTVKEKRPKATSDVFGDGFKDPKNILSITGKEKDNKDQLRFGLRILGNLNKIKESYVPAELGRPLKDEVPFFNDIAATTRAIQEIVNKIYTVVGYEAAPDFDYMVGPVSLDRKIKEFKGQDIGGTLVLETVYE